jgi:hypothetical protein
MSETTGDEIEVPAEVSWLGTTEIREGSHGAEEQKA